MFNPKKNNKKSKKTIFLSGGGTAGSVTPLLAMLGAVGDKYDYIWLGTRQGIEKEIIKNENIPYIGISSGKLRRYFSWKNFIDPLYVISGFFESLFYLRKYRPALVMSAGSFASVPLAWAAWLLGIPVLIHQLDYRPGLANRLMAPFAAKITVALKKSQSDYGRKAVWTGTFVRREFRQYKISENESRQRLNLKLNKDVVLILGGGTGAADLNRLVEESLLDLVKFCQIIHITGKAKGPENMRPIKNYHPVEFVHVDGMIKSYMAADLVVTRCGMGVLSEISFLGKPAILIPIPGSHQEDNARIFAKENAAVVLEQDKLSARDFVSGIKQVLKDEELRNRLSDNIERVAKARPENKISRIISELVNKEVSSDNYMGM